MTRWPAICAGDSLAISADCTFRAASCAAVGLAAGPWIASAACRGERGGTGELCGPSAGDDWPPAAALPAEPADEFELGVAPDEPQPAVSATAAAAAAPPTASQSR